MNVTLPKHTPGGLVYLIDTSSSMEGSRYRRAVQAFRDELLPDNPGLIIAFSNGARFVAGPDQIPQPGGGTDLFQALDLAKLVEPATLVVISDGEPADPDACITLAEFLPCCIQTFFCGSDTDHRGAEFMRRLARVGGGEFVRHDLATQALPAGGLDRLLGLPAPIAL